MSAIKLPKETERGFQKAVIDLARLHKWRVVHFRPAKTAKGWRTALQGDGEGWPDLIMVRQHRIIAAELKSETGKLSREQKEWIRALEWAGAEVYLWRPSQWSEIETILA